MTQNKSDLYWMNVALTQAKQAFSEDEIPVGAVLVKDNRIVLKNHNRTRQNYDATAHCEKLIIEEMINRGEKFLSDYTLYVTLEPCTMCAGMLVLARIGRVVFGCFDPKTGAAGSLYNIMLDKQLNHNPVVLGGVKERESSGLLRDFFASKRE